MRGFTDQVLEEAAFAAQLKYPEESCGLVIKDALGRQLYFDCVNLHPEPRKGYRIRNDHIRWSLDNDLLVAVVHSHPKQKVAVASEADRNAQAAMGVPYLIIPVFNRKAGEAITIT